MTNRAIHIARNQRIARPNQLCHSLLHNWDLNTHRAHETIQTRLGGPR